VSPVTTDPTGSLVPRTLVNLTFTISNPQSESNDFPDATDLKMFSELDYPTWSIALLSDGELRPLSGKQNGTVFLSDWGVAGFNRNTSHDQVKVMLSGYSPEVKKTMNKTLIRVSQLGLDNNPIRGSIRTVQTMIINGCCIRSPLPARKTDLQTLRSHIDEKTTMGIDTSYAEGKYTEAKRKIDNASALPSSQFSTAMSILNAADIDIQDGERLLDKAWAEKELLEAQVPFKKSDEIVHELMVRGARQDDTPELRLAIHQRELAIQKCSAASDLIGSGQYAEARERAAAAQTLGNESYTHALNVQKTWSRPLFRTPLSPLCCITGVLIAGILWWKKKKSGGTP